MIIVESVLSTYSYEINLAAIDSPLTIVNHYQPSPTAMNDSEKQILRVIVIFFCVSLHEPEGGIC